MFRSRLSLSLSPSSDFPVPADSADVSGLVLPPLLPFVVHDGVEIGALSAVEIPPTLEADHPCLSVTT